MVKTQYHCSRAITPKKVKAVKRALAAGAGLRETSRKTGVSYYTVWHINRGTYQTANKLSDVFAKPKDIFDYATMGKMF